MDLLYKDCITFNILGDELNIFCNNTDYGRSTVAELNDQFYYLGDKPVDLTSALFAWENLLGKILSPTELEEITKNNSENKSEL